MLVLSRAKGERIRISDDITITVVEISRGKVRIGIEAPVSVKVHRQEIYDRITRTPFPPPPEVDPDPMLPG